MLHEGIIEKSATEQANLSDGIDIEKEFDLIAEVSNTKTDAHYHMIMPDFLSKMADTMKKSKTPFLLDHNTQQKLGKSIDGYTVGEEMKMRAIGKFRIPRNWSLKVDTNEFIKGVENGTLDAVSVGIRVKKLDCSICKKPPPLTFSEVFFGDPKKLCFNHRPGRKYKKEVAKWYIHDGSLGEVSSVYAGANYTAEIRDYTKMILSEAEAYKDFTDSDLENIMPFMPEFSEIAKSYPTLAGVDKEFSFPQHLINPNPKTPTGGNDMDHEKELAKLIGQASTFMKELPDDPMKAIQKIVDECQKLHTDKTKAEANLAESKKKADKYDEYYNARIEKAIEFGVIAEGEDFDKEDWTEILKGYNKLSLVDKQMAKWAVEADEELPEEFGRQSVETKQTDLKKNTSDDEQTFDDWEYYA